MVAVVPMPRVRAHKVSIPPPHPKPPLMEISYQVWVWMSRIVLEAVPSKIIGNHAFSFVGHTMFNFFNSPTV